MSGKETEKEQVSRWANVATGRAELGYRGYWRALWPHLT